MTIEDVNKVCGYTSNEPTKRYAFLPNGASTSNITEEHNGKTYTITAHFSDTAKFYTYDEATHIETDSDGIRYGIPEVEYPVYVTSTYQRNLLFKPI